MPERSKASSSAVLILIGSMFFLHTPSVQAQATGPAPSGAKTRGPQPIGAVTQTWTGALFDTTRKACGGETKEASPTDTCPVSVSTVSFGIRLPDGKLYNFDEGGNPKASAALKKSQKGSKQAFSYWRTGKALKPITAHVTGSVTSDLLNLDTIRID